MSLLNKHTFGKKASGGGADPDTWGLYHGEDLLDSSGNGNHMTVVVAPDPSAFVPMKFGNGFGASTPIATGVIGTPPASAGMPVAGGGDWTVDFWVNLNGIVNNAKAFGTFTNVASPINTYIIARTTQTFWRLNTSAGLKDLISAASYDLTVDTHLALERHGQYLNAFIGGTRVNQLDIGAATTINNNGTYGWSLTKECFNSAGQKRVDELRISSIARYQGANFTPPTEPY